MISSDSDEQLKVKNDNEHNYNNMFLIEKESQNYDSF
jgi:hypothetical protein